MHARYPCPCCGYAVFEREPGSHAICPICHWEDNLVQLRFPTMPGAANSVSLAEGQLNYAEFGAVQKRYRHAVRQPHANEQQDSGWRCLDVERDNPEFPRAGVKYADSYPEQDLTVMYYWRSTYWRRLVS